MKKRMMVMETASSLLPIIFYTLLCILIVFIIVFVYKLIKTLDKKKIQDAFVYVENWFVKLDGLYWEYQ